MGTYGCPGCNWAVPFVRVGEDPDGEIVGPSADGLLIERRDCPHCGAHLERASLGRWHLARVPRVPPLLAAYS